MKVLYVNACVRKGSRTNKIARAIISRITDARVEEVVLDEIELLPLNEDRLNRRMDLIEKGKLDDPVFDLSRQFADADVIVMSAPYWDGSFPALLKLYIENIYVIGIVSNYGADGSPEGMCKAKIIYYVTTAGGRYDQRFSYDYVKNLASNYFGISETRLIKAEMLDVNGYDSGSIVENIIENL